MTSVIKMSILKNQTIQLTNTAIHIAIHTTDKMKSIDANPNTYTDFHVENNDKDPKFKTGDQVRISKDKRTFVKDYTAKLIRRSFCYQKKLILCCVHM